MRGSELRPLSGWLSSQPTWSDLPFIILTQRGGGPERNPAAARLSDMAGFAPLTEILAAVHTRAHVRLFMN